MNRTGTLLMRSLFPERGKRTRVGSDLRTNLGRRARNSESKLSQTLPYSLIIGTMFRRRHPRHATIAEEIVLCRPEV